MTVHHFEQNLQAAWPPDWWQVGTVLAVSGGADSVALLRATAHLAALGPARLAVAHFNHHLRGAESDADEQFVRELCGRLGINCHVGRPDAGQMSGPPAAEAAMRHARYDFLRRTAESFGARYVATAHTADDQAETILHHVLRGTGLAGLAGMPRIRALGPAVTLLRPMLGLSRRDVLAYLAELEQPYREDQTNRDRQFTRNRIRHELLPALARDYSPSIVERLLRLGTLAADAQVLIEREASRLLERMQVAIEPGRVTLCCAGLAAEDRHLVREALVQIWRRQDWPLAAMGFDEWNQLADMALAPCPTATDSIKHIFPGCVTVERRRDQLMLSTP